MAKDKLLPKPELDLPLPEKDLPLPRPPATEAESNVGQDEKELTAGGPEPAPKRDLATKDDALDTQTKSQYKSDEALLKDKEHMEKIPQGQILKAPPQTEPVMENHSGRKKMILSSFIFGIIFVIILVLIGVGVILSKQNSKPQNTQVVKTQVKPTSPTPTLTNNTPVASYTENQNVTSDWQIYNNPTGKFTIKYPPKWRISQSPDFLDGGFGPKEIEEDIAWAFNIYDKSKITIQEIANTI
jgi:hypothetical protein